MTIAALFDIDGTIYRDSLLISHYNCLKEHKMISAENQIKVDDLLKRWENRHYDYEDYLKVLVDIYVESMIGKDAEVYDILAKQVIQNNKDKLYRYTRDRIQWHKSQGHKVFFISGSPNFLVTSLAEALGVNLSFGSQYVVENQKFTGQVIPLWDSESKKNLIEKLVKEYDIDLSQSYAYGDTTGDLQMLKSVGYPVTINPNSRLMDLLIEETLPCKIILERKNLIWEFETKDVLTGNISYTSNL